MLSFAEPLWLLLLPLVGLSAATSLGRRKPAMRYSSLGLVAGLPRGRARRAVWGAVGLRTLGLSLLAVVAAGPRHPDYRTRLPADGVSVMLVLDVSGSMATADFGDAGSATTSRLAAARQAFRRLVVGGEAADGVTSPGRPQDSFGLVAFAAVPRTVCPVTLNHTVLVQLLDGQQAKVGPDAGTNVGDAVAEAVLRLDQPDGRRKVIVLLSDGEHNATREGENVALKPRQAAQLARALSIPIYAIDCGGELSPDAQPEDVRQRADGRLVLQSVAEMTDGRAFRADSVQELQVACEEIDRLERCPTATFRYRRYHDERPWFGLAGVTVLAATALLSRTRWRVEPC